jgi:hypothetical protein
MRIPGFTGATGGETRDSEAAVEAISGMHTQSWSHYVQIPFVDVVVEEMLGGLEATGVRASSPFESPLIVEVEDERPKLVRGARCVSFNSEAYAISHYSDRLQCREG